MRKTLSAAALVLALCTPSFAGDIPMPVTPKPPPGSAEQQSTDGQSDTPPVAADIFLDVALNLLSIF